MKLKVWEKLKLSWKYFVDNWKIYLWTNILYALIGTVVALIWVWIIFISVKLLVQGVEFWPILLFVTGILIVILGSRLGKALSFIANFYVTKWENEWNKLSFKEVFKIWFDKLKYKALIDVWYFIIWFLTILAFILFIGIWFALASVLWRSLGDIAWIATLIIFVVIWVYFLIKICLMFMLSDYYCFDHEKFDFKTFLNSRKIVVWKYLYLLLQIVILVLILSIAYLIIIMPFSWLAPSLYGLRHISSIEQLTSLVLVLFGVSAILYYIIRYLIQLVLWIYYFIYFFLVYKEINNSKENKQENPAS